MYLCSIASFFSKFINIIIDLVGPAGFVVLAIFFHFFLCYFVISSFLYDGDVK